MSASGVHIPIKWSFQVEGASQAKQSINEIKDKMQNHTLAMKDGERQIAQVGRTMRQSNNEWRVQREIILASNPALNNLTRAMSVYGSVANTALQISNAFNLMQLAFSNTNDKLAQDLQDIAQQKIIIANLEKNEPGNIAAIAEARDKLAVLEDKYAKDQKTQTDQQIQNWINIAAAVGLIGTQVIQTGLKIASTKLVSDWWTGLGTPVQMIARGALLGTSFVLGVIAGVLVVDELMRLFDKNFAKNMEDLQKRITSEWDVPDFAARLISPFVAAASGWVQVGSNLKIWMDNLYIDLENSSVDFANFFGANLEHIQNKLYMSKKEAQDVLFGKAPLDDTSLYKSDTGVRSNPFRGSGYTSNNPALDAFNKNTGLTDNDVLGLLESPQQKAERLGFGKRPKETIGPPKPDNYNSTNQSIPNLNNATSNPAVNPLQSEDDFKKYAMELYEKQKAIIEKQNNISRQNSNTIDNNTGILGNNSTALNGLGNNLNILNTPLTNLTTGLYTMNLTLAGLVRVNEARTKAGMSKLEDVVQVRIIDNKNIPASNIMAQPQTTYIDSGLSLSKNVISTALTSPITDSIDKTREIMTKTYGTTSMLIKPGFETGGGGVEGNDLKNALEKAKTTWRDVLGKPLSINEHPINANTTQSQKQTDAIQKQTGILSTSTNPALNQVDTSLINLNGNVKALSGEFGAMNAKSAAGQLSQAKSVVGDKISQLSRQIMKHATMSDLGEGWSGTEPKAIARLKAVNDDIDAHNKIIQDQIDELQKTAGTLEVGTQSLLSTYLTGVGLSATSGIGSIISQAIGMGGGITSGTIDRFIQSHDYGVFTQQAQADATSSSSAMSQSDYDEYIKNVQKQHHLSEAQAKAEADKNGYTPIKAASGFEGLITKPTAFLAGEAGSEYVSITPMWKKRNDKGKNNIIPDLRTGWWNDPNRIPHPPTPSIIPDWAKVKPPNDKMDIIEGIIPKLINPILGGIRGVLREPIRNQFNIINNIKNNNDKSDNARFNNAQPVVLHSNNQNNNNYTVIMNNAGHILTDRDLTKFIDNYLKTTLKMRGY